MLVVNIIGIHYSLLSLVLMIGKWLPRRKLLCMIGSRRPQWYLLCMMGTGHPLRKLLLCEIGSRHPWRKLLFISGRHRLRLSRFDRGKIEESLPLPCCCWFEGLDPCTRLRSLHLCIRFPLLPRVWPRPLTRPSATRLLVHSRSLHWKRYNGLARSALVLLDP